MKRYKLKELEDYPKIFKNLSLDTKLRIDEDKEISLDEYKDMRLNSYERKVLFPLFSDETKIYILNNCLKNSSLFKDSRYSINATYDEKIINDFIPLLQDLLDQKTMN